MKTPYFILKMTGKWEVEREMVLDVFKSIVDIRIPNSETKGIMRIFKHSKTGERKAQLFDQYGNYQRSYDPAYAISLMDSYPKDHP